MDDPQVDDYVRWEIRGMGIFKDPSLSIEIGGLEPKVIRKRNTTYSTLFGLLGLKERICS